MHRIWNGFNRVFRLRPAAPSQKTVCNEDNEISEFVVTSSDDKKSHKRCYTETTYDYKRFYDSNGSNWQGFQHSFKYLNLWDHLAYYVTALVVVDRTISWQLLPKRDKKSLSTFCPFVIKQRICGKFQNGFTPTILNVVGKVSRNIPLSSPNAHAARRNSISVVDQLLILKNDGVNSPVNESNTFISNAPKNQIVFTNKIQIDDDFESSLDDYARLTLHCMGLTHNIQGVNAYKAGEYENAVKYFELGSEKEFPSSQYNLALFHQNGIGTDHNTDKAIPEYQKASEQGHLEAKYNLAVIYLNKNDPELEEKALVLLHDAAKGGLVQAQSDLGLYFAQPGKNQNFTKSVEIFKMGAEKKDVECIYNLAGCYEHGYGGLEISTEKAKELYKLAEGQNHVESAFKLACILLNENKEGGKTQAIPLFEKAAKSGHEEAKQELKRLENKNTTTPNYITLPLYASTQNYTLPDFVQNLKMNSQNLAEHSSLVNALLQESIEYKPIQNGFHRVPTWPSYPVQRQWA